MTTTPTPEEFLALPSDPEEGEDLDEFVPVVVSPNGDVQTLQQWVHGGPGLDPVDPLTSIAESLQTIAGAAGVSAYLHQQAATLSEQLEETRRELADAEALARVQADLIESVREVVKPSTSKLANSVREVLGAASFVAPTAEVETPEQPADDADVETWRTYARSLGYAGPNVDKANRSQIRTMLGIPHPASE